MLDRYRQRNDKYCTSPTFERRLEVFVWVSRYKADEGGALARLANCYRTSGNPPHRYYKHEATLPDIFTTDLSPYTLTPPKQSDFQLLQAVTDYLRRKQKWKPEGWYATSNYRSNPQSSKLTARLRSRKFKCELADGREQLLSYRGPEPFARKVILLEREVPCACGRGRNCFRVRTSAGRAYATAVRRQAALSIQDCTTPTRDGSAKARMVSPPAGSVVTWADPPAYEEADGRP